MFFNSLAHSLEEKEGPEYPFPNMDAVEPTSSPSDTPPSRTRSLRSNAQGSSSSSSRHHRSRAERERDRDRAGTPTKHLSRLISRDDRDVKRDVRTLLVLTTERLDAETRRADQAEQRVLDALYRLRSANDATMLAQSEAARANESVRLYQLQLDNAQREILRAQDILNQVEKERADAEADAAQARTTARRLREERLFIKAREEGRKEGYREGYSKGKNAGLFESSQAAIRANARRQAQMPAVTGSQSDEVEMLRDEQRTPAISPIHRVTPASTHSPIPQSAQHPDILRSGRDFTSPERVPDVALHPPALPIPTLTTPVIVPSPLRAPRSPSPFPVADPQARRSNDNITPIPIRNAVPSPTHPPIDIIPDGFIPYVGEDHVISLPPPHELSRPVSPHSPSPAISNAPLPVPQAANGEAYVPDVHTRDYAYTSRAARPMSGPAVPMSPQSRTSTRISQYDLVGPRGEPNIMNERRAGRAGHDFGQPSSIPQPPNVPQPYTGSTERETRSSRGARPYTPNDATARPSSFDAPENSDRHSGNGAAQPSYDDLFRNLYRKRSPPKSSNVVIPDIDINVESPSTAPSASLPSSARTTMHQSQFLSPEHANRPLPAPEEIRVMRFEAPENPLPIPPQSPPSLGLLGQESEWPHRGFVPSRTRSTPTPPSQERRGTSRSSLGSGERAAGRKSSISYATAPIPEDVVYPKPPGRPSTPYMMSAVARNSSSSSSSGSSDSGRRRQNTTNHASRLSPLALGQPIGFFASSDG